MEKKRKSKTERYIEREGERGRKKKFKINKKREKEIKLDVCKIERKTSQCTVWS